MQNDRDRQELISKLTSTRDLVMYIADNYPSMIEKELNRIKNDVIDRWYGDYFRYRYDPSFSLYDACKITISPVYGVIGWDIEYSDTFIKREHHQSNEIVFHNAFELGFHGGSMREGYSENELYYRTPHPFYTEWGEPAAKSFSPKEEIEKETKEYWDKLEKETQDALKKRIVELRIALNRYRAGRR